MSEVKKLIIPEVRLASPERKEEFPIWSRDFNQCGRPASIDQSPWKDFSDSSELKFRIAWFGDKLFVKFYVKEREILGTYTKDLSDVFKDSCVELFLSPEGSESYYNFEFNCIGTCLAQYGKQRNNRVALPVDTLKEIVRIPSLGKQALHQYHEGLIKDIPEWSLMLVIPSSVFCFDSIETFRGQKMRGNFYKCGDSLESPHYFSWNPVLSEQPDFHRPEHFGEIWFT